MTSKKVGVEHVCAICGGHIDPTDATEALYTFSHRYYYDEDKKVVGKRECFCESCAVKVKFEIDKMKLAVAVKEVA